MKQFPLDYEPDPQVYEAYQRYLDQRTDEEPFYTFSGWLHHGDLKTEKLDKKSKA